MSMTDPIADMLTRIRNANSAQHDKVEMPSSKMLVGIAQILKEQGYVKDYRVRKADSFEVLEVYLKYNAEKTPSISGLKRISKPGLRVYARKDQIPKVLGGLGIAIISTSQGLMTNRQASKSGMGGEVICYVW
ncbi:MAG: 30S ribosomal protein S8 [Actinobacteria bacterium]|nr:MAG: 30S ribosomal protein S8 [Actinomycetota bacterium]